MKKSYLMIAAAAMLVACAEKDTFKEINNTEGAQISFSTYAQKATRAVENSTANGYSLNLKDHHLSFAVYGYKNTDSKAVFNGDSVGYDNNENKWGYLLNRYWDKTATTYEFYAFAPYNAPFIFHGANSIENQKNCYFEIAAGYNKAGENVSPKNSQDPVAVWKDKASTDIDLMIADTCRLSGEALANAQNSQVTLNFIHILSRLNITVKTIDELDPTDATKDSLCVDSIIISNFAHAGSFDETRNSIDSTKLVQGTTKRWDATDAAKYRYDINYTATTDPIYVIEALMIPQEIEKDTINLDGTFPAGTNNVNAPYIKIAYTIYSYDPSGKKKKANNSEHYVAYYNLAKIFGVKDNGSKLAFNEGWQNTLNITVSPAIIKFDAKVAPWADDKNENLEVK